MWFRISEGMDHEVWGAVEGILGIRVVVGRREKGNTF